jgi:UDP-galactopyranose mutase
LKKAVIIGAGISGCMPAMLLQEKGWAVTVIDKAGFTGGGLRTFFHGGHPYTFGPRHFLSPYPEAFEFLNKYVPMRHINKINYTFMESEGTFHTYPIHEDDIDKIPESEKIRQELASLPEQSSPRNFEEFWIQRVGLSLYSRYVKEYNRKAWILDSNTEMDFDIEATVKRRPLETGERYEYRDWFNCYPIAADGYNKFFDIALDSCDVRLNTTITGYDPEDRAVYVGDEKVQGDILISTISADQLMDYQFGELRYVGRDFHKIVLPTESIFPEDVYFVYYPNANEAHTRVVEYKKFTLHESPFTLLGLEIPSMKNKLYPMMIQSEVDKAQCYIDALPPNVFSVGRMGRYRYIDIDDIILESVEFVRNL